MPAGTGDAIRSAFTLQISINSCSSHQKHMKKEIPHRNRSSYGWWIASYIERAVWDDDPNPSPNSRCLSWENTILLQAPDRKPPTQKQFS